MAKKKIQEIDLSDEIFIQKVIEISCLIDEFDGQIFDLDKIRKRLKHFQKNPLIIIAEDIEKTITEFPKYSSDYGIYELVNTPDGTKIKLTREAKKFLIQPEADIEGFFSFQAVL